MNKKNYHVTKSKKEGKTLDLEIDKLDGYVVKPRVKKEDSIKVDKIMFVDDELSEKIVRKKIDAKIEYLLYKLKMFDNDDDSSGSIQKSLMDAEKLRLQIINKYVKYLGHTYYGLTLKKIELIIDELNYRLYMNEFNKEQNVYYNNEREGRKGR